MSFLDILNRAATIPEVQHIEFLQNYKFSNSTLHLFYEGIEDATFYNSYIQNMIGNKYSVEYYICDGKDNVLNNYSTINWRKYNKNRVLFFIDKDLDDILGLKRVSDDNIFVTKYYSIENYLVTKDVVDRFFSETCNVRNIEARKLIKAQFDIQLMRFHKQLLTFTAWIIFCRSKNHALNLNDVNIRDFIYVDRDLIVHKKRINGYKDFHEYLCKRTKTNHSIPPGEILKCVKELKKKSDPKIFIRGKYELQFLFIFCNMVIKEILPKLNDKISALNNGINSYRIRKCTIFSLTVDNTFDILAAKLQIPEDLKTFLTYNMTKAKLLN